MDYGSPRMAPGLHIAWTVGHNHLGASSGYRLQREQRFEVSPPASLAVDLLPFPAAIVDPDGRIRAVNRQWQLREGASPGDGWMKWCEAVPGLAPGERDSLASRIQALLGSVHAPFV